MPWTNDQTWALVNKPQPEEIRLVDLVNKPDPEEIYHHGIKGQKWGVRRYQNPDGSLTPEGRKHYGYDEMQKSFNESYSRMLEKDRKLEKKQFEEANQLSKKLYGMSYDKLRDEAVKQNDLIDSGKLQYEDSVWKKYNDIEEEVFGQFGPGKYQHLFDKNKFLDKWFEDHDNLTWEEAGKLVKKYDPEHGAYHPDDAFWTLFDRLDGSDRYEFDENFDIRRKSNGLKDRFERAKKEDPETFKKVAGEGFDDYDKINDPELVELVLNDYEEYKKGNNEVVDHIDKSNEGYKKRNNTTNGKYTEQFSFNKTLSDIYKAVDTKGRSEKLSDQMYKFLASDEFSKMSETEKSKALSLFYIVEGWDQDESMNMFG